ncbi:MAG: T9SS type A sorting domain-containing protein [Bacteroidia bacterium]
MSKISTLLTKLAIFSFVFFGISFNAIASHYAGSDMYYECLGGNQYKVTLVFYRDCSGIDEPPDALINLTNVCTGSATSTSIFKKPDGVGFTNGQEISSTCTGVLSTCNGGTAPGLRKWIYEGNVTIASGCTNWKISYELCCRNGAITTLQNGSSEALYTETSFNSSICDNAPRFSNNPIAFACVNQPFNYNQGAFDADGDSLAYELDDPLSNGGVPVLFNAGFSKTAPFAVSSAFTLNSATGAVSFTPNALQVGVVAIKVKEFRNGVLIGYVRRDMEIFVTNCNNNTLPVASGFNGTTNNSISACAGQQICAAIHTSDIDLTQTVTVNWNSGIANATFVVGSGSNPTATFCWTPAAADIANNPNVFTVTVKDDACPTNGEQTFSYVVNVVGKPAVTVSKTDATCGGSNGSATANTNANNAVLWSTGSSNATISGLSAGAYTVTVTNGTGCSTSASVTIGSSNGTVSLSGQTTTDNGTCNGAIDLNVGSGTSPFAFSWSNGATTEDISGICSGTYTVNVTDANGCAGTASFTVPISTGCNIVLTLHSNDEGYCKIGGIVICNTLGLSGQGTAVLTNSGGVVLVTKIFTNALIFDKLKSDTYTVTVTDAAGCSASASAYVGNGNCGAPVNVHTSNVTSSSATITWDNCNSNKHTVRYKVKGAGNPFSYLTVTNTNQAVLSNLINNTIYSVRVRAVCSKGKYTQYTVPKLFCTGGCTIPKLINESELLDDSQDLSVSFVVTPNPSSDYINIIGESNVTKSTKVVFTNILGKVMMTKDLTLTEDSFDKSFDISELPQGVYIINIAGFENISLRFIKM